MMSDLIGLTHEGNLERFIKGPLRWPGSKNQAVTQILPELPTGQIYGESFGGTAVLLINRKPSKLEVYNDINRGLVNFFRCLRNPEKCRQLIDLINYSIHSRYEFETTKLEREHQDKSDVLRAFAFYYSYQYSFSGLGKNFGRSISGTARVANIRDNIPGLNKLNDRLRYVQVEELDFRQFINDYAKSQSVLYHDPPYLDMETNKDRYDSGFTTDDHLDLIHLVQSSPGFHAISGYPNPIYNDFKWDKVKQWDQTSYMQGTLSVGERKANVTEVLWIKDNR